MSEEPVAETTCPACAEHDHYLCSEGDCECSCNKDDGKLWGTGRWKGYRENRFDALPHAGSKARRNWIGRNAEQVRTGEYHLHALFNRGRVMWVVVGKGSGLCKQPGRCKKVRIEVSA